MTLPSPPLRLQDPVRVTQADLERQLSRITASTPDPVAGAFGPGSMMWHIDREAAIFLGGGRAALLQLAHPWVGAAIARDSRVMSDRIGRFHRTFDMVFSMVFGSLDQAVGMARRLHRLHSRIQGTLEKAAGPFPAGSSYFANELSALRWVHATLVDTSALIHGQVIDSLTPAQRAQHYAEASRFAALFGIPEEALPATLEEFEAYNRAMWHSDILTVTPEARAIGTELIAGTGHWLRIPGWYRDLTVHLLPEPLRDRFGFPYGEAERRSAERAIAWIRRGHPLLPERLRLVGPYQEAMGRIAGAPRPHLPTRLLNHFWIGHGSLGG